MWLALLATLAGSAAADWQEVQSIAEDAYWFSRRGYDADIPHAIRRLRGSWPCMHGLEAARYVGFVDVGYTTCGLALLKKPCVVYSVGSGSDFAFEEAIQRSAPECEILIFDPDGAPPGSKWPVQMLGLSNVSGTQLLRTKKSTKLQQVLTLKDIMARYKHQHLDILKVDVEGLEHVIFQRMVKEGFPSIGSILTEVHIGERFGQAPEAAEKLVHLLEKQGFRLYSAEPNYYWGRDCCAVLGFIQAAWDPQVKDYPGLRWHRAASFGANIVSVRWTTLVEYKDPSRGATTSDWRDGLEVGRGARLLIAVDLLNSGKVPWHAGCCEIRNVRGNAWGYPGIKFPAKPVPIGGTGGFRFEFKLPDEPGPQVSHWRLLEGDIGAAFGPPLDFRLRVV